MAEDTFYVTPSTGEGGGVADSVAWADVTGKPSFSTVALTGAFSDLSSAPITETASGNEVVDLRVTDGSAYLDWEFSDSAPAGYRGTIQTDHIFGRSLIARDEKAGSMTGLVVGATQIDNGKMGFGDVTAAANQISLFTAGDVRVRVGNSQTDVTGALTVGSDLTVTDDILAGGEVAANDFKVLNQLCIGHSSPQSALHLRGERDVSGNDGIHMGTDASGGYGIELVSGDGNGEHGFFVGASGDAFKGKLTYALDGDKWIFTTRQFSAGVLETSNASTVIRRTCILSHTQGITFTSSPVTIYEFAESLTDASNALPTSYAVKKYVDKRTGTFSFYTSSDRLDSSGIGMTWNGYIGTAIEGSFNHQSEWSYDPLYVTTSGVINPHVFDTNCPCLQLQSDEWSGHYRVDFDAFVVSMEQSKASLIPFCYLNGYDSSSSLPIDSSGILKTDASHLSCKISCDSLKIDGGRSGSFHGVVEMASGDTLMVSCMLADETTSGRSFIDFYPHNRQLTKFKIRSNLTLTYLG